jgi:hypothetical protein
MVFLFEPLIETVAPGREERSDPVTIPVIIFCWENTELTIKKRSHERRNDLACPGKDDTILIKSILVSIGWSLLKVHLFYNIQYDFIPVQSNRQNGAGLD